MMYVYIQHNNTPVFDEDHFSVIIITAGRVRCEKTLKVDAPPFLKYRVVIVNVRRRDIMGAAI